MWASQARYLGSCESRVLCVDWQESSGQEGGWLVTGCSSGTVGVSWIDNKETIAKKKEEKERPRPDGAGRFTVGERNWDSDEEEEEECEGNEGVGRNSTTHEDNLACTREACLYKSHFILRNHTGEVRLVRWMPNGDRLASYDSWGRIIIWKNRANILAYDLEIKTSLLVTDMQWSPCGYYLLLCGREGHVQSFSAINGLNLFSIQVEATNSNSKKAEFTCCSWSRPGTRVALGTENGEVVVIDPSDNGRSISTISMHKGIPVLSLEWYGDVSMCMKRSGVTYETQSLSAYLKNGDVMLFKSLDHPDVNFSRTSVVDGRAVWNSSSTVLAVVGYKKTVRSSMVRFLNDQGYILFTVSDGLPTADIKLSLRNVKWGLNDSTLFQTWGSDIFSMEVNRSLPTLQFLARRVIMEGLEYRSEEQVSQLPLPRKEIEQLNVMKRPLVSMPFNTGNTGNQEYLTHPLSAKSLEALMHPLPASQRLHCRLDSSEDGYILMYEHLHHYVPILCAKKKRGSLIYGGYRIEPAFDCNVSHDKDQTGTRWATKIQRQSSPCGDQVSSPLRSRSSILRQLRSAFKPGHSQGVMDISSQQKTSSSSSTRSSDLIEDSSRESSASLKRPVLAEIEGNSIMNRFRFRTGCSLFQDGVLGSLNITTNYIKCQPRKLAVYLSGPGLSAQRIFSGDGEGDEFKIEETNDISLFSKDPDWNERYQIYELDFGGRVSTDSIKNFQIEREGRVVMQFGRSYSRRFSLDFEAPFSPVQAFCVALACIA